MKNASSRNRFLLCFRPVVDMDLMLESNGCYRSRKGQAFDYISSEKKSSVSCINGCSRFSETDTTPVRPRPKKRSFSQQFQTMLAKRVGDRKSLSHRYSNKYKSKRSVSADTDINIPQTKSNPVSVSPQSSSSSSSLIPSEVQLQAKKQKTHDSSSSSYSRLSFCVNLLVMISLTLTIIWGRICAIVFTSVWLYFSIIIIIPHHRQSISRRPDEYEKKLIRKRSEAAGFTCA